MIHGVLNVVLIWALFIAVVVFISDTKGPTRKKTKKAFPKIVFPTIVLPKIIFKPVNLQSVLAGAQSTSESIPSQVLSENVVNTVLNDKKNIKDEKSKKENCDDVESSLEGQCEVEPDYDNEVCNLASVINYLNKDDKVLETNTKKTDEDYAEEIPVKGDEEGIWTDNINNDNIEVEFDPKSFYANAENISCEIQTGQF